MAVSTAVQVTTSCALPGATPTPITCARSVTGGGGGGGGTLGVPVISSEGGPSVTPVRVAITRTVYSVPLMRLGIVWRVVDPDVTGACRSPVL